ARFRAGAAVGRADRGRAPADQPSRLPVGVRASADRPQAQQRPACAHRRGPLSEPARGEVTMTASKPAPRPGILDISPYVPGKSGSASAGRVFKLSSNESPIGPSPEALRAFAAASQHMHLYPEGSAAQLRQAIAE